MKTRNLFFLLIASLSSTTLLFAQGGDLLPSIGNGALDGSKNPQPSMKSLAQIEPRTLISSLPFTISTPGSYYLGGNLTTATSGITVNASDTTIDLNGFTITGSDTAANRV